MRKQLLLGVLCACALLSYAQRPGTVTMATTFPSGNIAYKALGVHNQMDLGLSNSNASLEIQSKPLNVGNPSNQSSGQTVISSSVGLVNVKTLKGTGKAELGSSVTGTGVAQVAVSQLETSIDSSCNNDPRCEGTPGLGAKTLEVLGNSKVFLYGKDLMSGCTEGANWQKIGEHYYLVCGSINCTTTQADCGANETFDPVACACKPNECPSVTCVEPKTKLNTTSCECECRDEVNDCQFFGLHYDPNTCTCEGSECTNVEEWVDCAKNGGSWDDRHCECDYPCIPTSSYWKTQQSECEGRGKRWKWDNCTCVGTGSEGCELITTTIEPGYNTGEVIFDDDPQCTQNHSSELPSGVGCCRITRPGDPWTISGQYFSECSWETNGQRYQEIEIQDMRPGGGCWRREFAYECKCE